LTPIAKHECRQKEPIDGTKATILTTTGKAYRRGIAAVQTGGEESVFILSLTQNLVHCMLLIYCNSYRWRISTSK
jgi:hypothetical protein